MSTSFSHYVFKVYDFNGSNVALLINNQLIHYQHMDILGLHNWGTVILQILIMIV